MKQSQESDISTICPEVPHERIFSKLVKMFLSWT